MVERSTPIVMFILGAPGAVCSEDKIAASMGSEIILGPTTGSGCALFNNIATSRSASIGDIVG